MTGPAWAELPEIPKPGMQIVIPWPQSSPNDARIFLRSGKDFKKISADKSLALRHHLLAGI